MTTPSTNVQYTKVAVILHWLIALAIITMLTSGLVMGSDLLEKGMRLQQLYQWHKSLGVIVLWLVGIRLLWRITHKPPALPESLNENEKFWAHTGHWILYLWMFVMPLSGWILVSSHPSGIPTFIFDGPEWPHFPGVKGEIEIHELAEEIHEFFGYSFIALIVGHLAAVIVHKVKHKTSLLPRMSLKRSAPQVDASENTPTE